jgi:hypothetical protein
LKQYVTHTLRRGVDFRILGTIPLTLFLSLCLDDFHAIFDQNIDFPCLAAPIVPTSDRSPFYQCRRATGSVNRHHQG